MPLLETKGAASAQGFGEFAKSGPANYIEDVFQTWLYTGNSSTQTITNGIDLSTKGGLVWLKARSTATGHGWFDTARGVLNYIGSESTSSQISLANSLTAFNTTGFNLGAYTGTNNSGVTYASWTFRKQAKFFDIVTYTGNGSNRNIAHNLGSVPGCIIVKRLDSSGSEWVVYHRSLANTQYLTLNDTVAARTGATYWNSTTPTATEFSLGTNIDVNANSGTYVAYLFAHDAGGFGLTGSDNVISCGSYSGTGTTPLSVTVGYEPQWLIIKGSSSGATGNWFMWDNMRGLVAPLSSSTRLQPNTTGSETTSLIANITATGFEINTTGASINAAGETYIYIAIRRGPMKVPTSGTSVFSPNVVASDFNGATTGFPVDMLFELTTGVDSKYSFSRLTENQFFRTSATTSGTGADSNWYRSNTGIGINGMSITGAAAVYESFRRAPGYFDVVCYTGDGTNSRQVTHNLGVIPGLIVLRRSDSSGNWHAWNTNYTGAGLYLNRDQLFPGDTPAFNTTQSATTINLAANTAINTSSVQYVAYLFATCAGVSKVGSYTGTGALQTVDCGFTGGARFVLIKRTDTTGDWWVYDSARGISSGNDPYLFINSTAAEVTNTNYVDTDTTGFKVTAAAPAGLNANGGTYIFLAIA